MAAPLATAGAGRTAYVRTTMDSLSISQDESSEQILKTDLVSFDVSSVGHDVLCGDAFLLCGRKKKEEEEEVEIVVTL